MDDRIFIDEKGLIYDPRTGDTFSTSKEFYEKLREELSDRFEKFAEELQKTGYLAGNRLVKAINDAYYGVKKTETLYGNEQGVVFLDENAFDYTFTGSDGLIEKMEPAKPVYDISWIRKRMKCCKNPMERKQLEKQLNAAYKARKKARKNK